MVGCSICQYSSAFGFSSTFYLGYPSGHLLGKSCRLGFPLVLFLCRLYCLCSFPVWCLGEDAELDLSLPGYCLFIYFTTILRPHLTVWKMLFVFQSLSMKMLSINESYSIRLIGNLYQRVLTNEMVNVKS